MGSIFSSISWSIGNGVISSCSKFSSILIASASAAHFWNAQKSRRSSKRQQKSLSLIFILWKDVCTFKISIKLSLILHFSSSSSNDRNSLVSRRRNVSILVFSLTKCASNLMRRSLCTETKHFVSKNAITDTLTESFRQKKQLNAKYTNLMKNSWIFSHQKHKIKSISLPISCASFSAHILSTSLSAQTEEFPWVSHNWNFVDDDQLFYTCTDD